jgi:predicted CXXCH cytochrome family protein
MKRDMRIAVIMLFLFMALLSSSAAAAQSCLDCHGDLIEGKTAHQAVAMGCESCHSAIDASDIPHKKKNKIAKGLSAEQPDLCYGCHDRAPFDKKVLHAAVGMGCTGCHNPHASKNPKLIVSPMPDLCYSCHDKAGFSKKTVHPPVASGDCLTCHVPHSGDNPSLLLSPVPDLCLMCHDTMNSKHVLAGYGLGGHPISGKADPSRPGKEISCTSCHTPHSSLNPFLFTNATGGSGGLCLACHAKIMVR